MAITPGSAATITLDGLGSRLTLTAPTTLTNTVLSLTNAAALSASDLIVSGRLTLAANSTLQARTLSLGTSPLTLTGGATLTATTLNADAAAITLDGAGTRLSLATPTIFGHLSTSTAALNLTNNANLTTTDLDLTYARLILDTGSTLQTNNLVVGASPLTIAGGATLTATTLTAPALNQSAAILITGPGSRLTLANATTAPITLTQGATLVLPSLTINQTSLAIDATSTVAIGLNAPTTAGYAIAAAATLTLNNTTLTAPVTNNGTVRATDSTIVTATGSGTYTLAAGTLEFTRLAATAAFTAPFQTIRLRGLAGFATIANIQPGDTIDLPGFPTTLTGNIITVGQNTLTLAATAGTQLRLDTVQTGIRITATDPLFDPTYYLARNPDVAAAGIDPYQHFSTYGWAEGRDPSALFSLAYYRTTYPNLAGQNGLLDYEQGGWQAGRNPNPYFNTNFYLAQNSDVAAAGLNPLAHYQANGWREGRDPSSQFSISQYRAAYPTAEPKTDALATFLTTGNRTGQRAIPTGPAPELGFDAPYYYAHNSDVLAAGINAMAHWSNYGMFEGRAPNAVFDPSYYRVQKPELPATKDPLADYFTTGAAQGRDPSLLFSASKYLAAYQDVAATGINPMLHYITYGQAEGRMAFLPGPTAAADSLVQTSFYDRQLGATLIPTGTAANQQAAAHYDTYGWQHGLNPDAYFDTQYYLARNPDVAAAKINPLLHYESNGWKEGRNPSAAFSTRGYLIKNPDVAAANLNPLAHYLNNGQFEGRLPIPV